MNSLTCVSADWYGIYDLLLVTQFPVCFHLLCRDANLMCALQLGKNNPRREDAQHRNAEVETNTDEVVGTTFGLHTVKIVSHWKYTCVSKVCNLRPCNSLTQRLHTSQDTSKMAQVR
jgi:hypothetical protein